jgi:hypothetical protein
VKVRQAPSEGEVKQETEETTSGKLTTSKLAQRLKMKTNELTDQFVQAGFLEVRNGKHYITDKGKEVGGEFRMSPKFGAYFLWPETLHP